MAIELDEATVAAFRTDGVVPVRGVFKEWIEPLRSGVGYNIENPGPFGRSYMGDGGGGRFLSDYCNWQRIPEYRDFIFNSPVAVLAAQLMGSREVRLFHEHVLVKEPQAGVATPWHQDAPYYCVQGPKTVSFWVPLDEVPRERTLEFIAGSHKGDRLFQPQYFNGKALNEGDGLDTLPDIDADRTAFDIRGWALSPGDAIAFDYRTVHGAPVNNSPSTQRRAFSLRLVGDDARFVRLPGKATSPPFPDLALKTGDRLDVPEFPVLLDAS